MDRERAGVVVVSGPGRMGPVSGGERIVSLDALRGLALLGILAMNVMAFSMPIGAYANPTVFPAYEGVNRWVYPVVHVLFDFKMMTLFSMLFGAGLIVFAGKATTPAEVRRVRWLWFRRNFWLLVIGLVHAYFIWEGDILVPYAVSGLVALWWLRRLPAWAMVLVGLGMMSVSTAVAVGQGWFVTQVVRPDAAQVMTTQWQMTSEQADELLEGLLVFFAPTPEMVSESIELYRGGYAGILQHRAEMGLWMHLQAIPFFLFWRVTGVMLIGAALMKTGVFTGERSARFYGLMALAGYGVGLPLVLAGLVYNHAIRFEPGMFAMVGMQFNGVGSVPMALGHAGVVLLLVKVGALGGFMRRLEAVGQMAFTNYLTHSVVCTLVFCGYGLGQFGRFDRLDQQALVVAIWAAQLALSPWWLSRFRFGPAEWAWRSLTYWRLQPMRR